jgi:hypothetical protein
MPSVLRDEGGPGRISPPLQVADGNLAIGVALFAEIESCALEP